MKKLLPLAALATAALLTACGGGSGSDDPGVAGAANTDANITAATVPAVVGQSFQFSNGVPEFGTATPTTLSITSSSSFAVQSTEGQATGDLSFGSCIFTVRTTTYPTGPFAVIGAFFEVQNCFIRIPTLNFAAFGPARPLDGITFRVGSVFSGPFTGIVDLSDDGTVELNGTTVGNTPVRETTGANGF